jgi:hypothetical protein
MSHKGKINERSLNVKPSKEQNKECIIGKYFVCCFVHHGGQPGGCGTVPWGEAAAWGGEGAYSEMADRTYTRWLPIVLWVTALHSFFTGAMLVLQPAALLRWSGFTLPVEAFFPAQGGVFHILMAVLYGAAARRRSLRVSVSGFIVFVKGSAAVFLLAYYLFVSPIWLVLLSGIGDGFIAIVLAYFSREEGRAHVTG